MINNQEEHYFPLSVYVKEYMLNKVIYEMLCLICAIIIALTVLITICKQTCNCCCKNRKRYVAPETYQNRYASSWEKLSFYQRASSLQLLVTLLFTIKMVQCFAISYALERCVNSEGIYKQYDKVRVKGYEFNLCLSLTCVPSILQMLTQFLIILIYGSLANGFRTLYKEMYKSMNFCSLHFALFTYAGLRLFQFNLPEQYLSTSMIIYIEVLCSLMVSGSILIFTARISEV